MHNLNSKTLLIPELWHSKIQEQYDLMNSDNLLKWPKLYRKLSKTYEKLYVVIYEGAGSKYVNRNII